ncbi:MAG: Ycf48-like protein precursor [Mucilaginibacter sp.]|nr:Ycf48-like protein precursor [Mucilaginibacter sp.]
MKKNFILILCGALLLLNMHLKAQHIELLQQDKNISIRGLSVVDDKIAWISSSKGTVALTTDGGKTWGWQQVKGFEKADFRDIEAFSDKEAVIMSSGTPALILKTVDGGANWQVKYQNTDTTYFLDAMDFDTPLHGFVMGDPINGQYLLMETKDGGNNWSRYSGPDALPGQAAFAASGTCLRANGLLAIVTGGSSAEVLIQNKKSEWKRQPVPIVHGQSAQGAFSVAMGTAHQLIVVGGDYQKDKRQDSTACYSIDKGITWHLANTPTAGYQSCVEFIEINTFISTGTPGSCITIDGGKTWTKIDDTSYNVCRKAKHGNLVLLAGNGGKIGIFKM